MHHDPVDRSVRAQVDRLGDAAVLCRSHRNRRRSRSKRSSATPSRIRRTRLRDSDAASPGDAAGCWGPSPGAGTRTRRVASRSSGSRSPVEIWWGRLFDGRRRHPIRRGDARVGGRRGRRWRLATHLHLEASVRAGVYPLQDRAIRQHDQLRESVGHRDPIDDALRQLLHEVPVGVVLVVEEQVLAEVPSEPAARLGPGPPPSITQPMPLACRTMSPSSFRAGAGGHSWGCSSGRQSGGCPCSSNQKPPGRAQGEGGGHTAPKEPTPRSPPTPSSRGPSRGTMSGRAPSGTPTSAGGASGGAASGRRASTAARSGVERSAAASSAGSAMGTHAAVTPTSIHLPRIDPSWPAFGDRPRAVEVWLENARRRASRRPSRMRASTRAASW